ncbi:hypothetical protein ACFOWM_03450 [Ferruginibacter yonginensis]|uniref:Thiol-activated cytolysin n=1 Tax=Ferruginibacter yonginensis TaxID=1310416 RepID=A0ABV8QSB1_9BACT
MKTKSILMLLALTIATTTMAQTPTPIKISELPTLTGNPLGGFLPIVKSGTTKKILVDSLPKPTLAQVLTKGYVANSPLYLGATNSPTIKFEPSASVISVFEENYQHNISSYSQTFYDNNNGLSTTLSPSTEDNANLIYPYGSGVLLKSVNNVPANADGNVNITFNADNGIQGNSARFNLQMGMPYVGDSRTFSFFTTGDGNDFPTTDAINFSAEIETGFNVGASDGISRNSSVNVNKHQISINNFQPNGASTKILTSNGNVKIDANGLANALKLLIDTAALSLNSIAAHFDVDTFRFKQSLIPEFESLSLFAWQDTTLSPELGQLNGLVVNYGTQLSNAFDNMDVQNVSPFPLTGRRTAANGTTYNLVVERRNSLTFPDTLFLRVNKGGGYGNGTYYLEIKPIAAGNNVASYIHRNILLRDKYTGITTEFSNKKRSFYQYVVSDDAGSFGDRFEVITTKAVKDFTRLVIENQEAPASSTAPGKKGEVRFTSEFIYYCPADNTWVRTALTTW